MEQTAKDDRISSLEFRLSSLIKQLSDLERRLSVLERSSRNPRTLNPAPKPAPSHQPTKINHNYLNRAISIARRDYARKFK
jgi:hypothetical protein